jgi:esterase/lipase superfamily enzyme
MNRLYASSRRRRVILIVAYCALACAGCAREEDGATREPSSAPSVSTPEASDASGAAAPVSPPETRTAEAPPRLLPDVTRRQAATGQKQPFTTVRVFYGTNRVPTGDRTPARFFGTGTGPLSFGFCDVSIPRDHEIGELESPKLWKFEFRADPEEHVVLLNVEPAEGARFITELQRAVWESIEWRQTADGPVILGGDAFVFVHGFNNSFEDAARRTAQIAKDVRFRGAPIMYSWPSQEGAALASYQADAEAISAAEEHFLAFLAGVARQSGARRVHVIAHSMGNRLVVETLRKLSYHVQSEQLPKFSQVILTAPDIDADYFRAAIAPRLVQTAERITVYSSSRDLALRASSFVNRLGRRRLGEAGTELMTFPEYRSIEVVDASQVDTGLFSLRHSYHADSPTVLGDLRLVLSGHAPGERQLEALWGTLAWRLRATRRDVEQAGYTEFR